MTELTESFHKSAALVKLWGRAKLQDGKTLEDILTIEGISMWSVVSPILAMSYIPDLVSKPSIHKSPLAKIKRFAINEAKKTKRHLFDCKAKMASNTVGCDSWPKDSTFLCLGFTHYISRETLYPVANKLSIRPESSVVVIDDLFSAENLLIEHFEVIRQSVWQHWYPAINYDISKMRKALKSATTQLYEPSGLKKIVEASGFHWCDVKHLFDWLLQAYMPRLLVYVAIAKHIVSCHRPALIISPDVNNPLTRIFCLAGKLNRIKTLEVQFSFYGANDVEWYFFVADHLAVTGNENFKLMLDRGISPEKMTVTGSARYDSLLSWPIEHVMNIRKQLGISVEKKLVLFASQPYYFGAFCNPAIRHKMINGLFDAVSNVSGIKLVVKPHPGDDPNELMSIAKGYNNIIFTARSLDIRDLIKASDVFVTFYSSTTFDALAMNKPTINLAYPKANPSNPIENSGATLVAKNDEEVSRFINSISSGKIDELFDGLSNARDVFLYNWFYQLDGRAAERIESIALNMASFEKDFTICD